MQKTDISGVKPIIFSPKGLVLTAEEKAFFAEEQPFGFVLFTRNVNNPEQVQTLIQDMKDSVGRSDAPVLVDQEGGRVQRLREPHWFNAPSFATLGALYEKDNVAGIRATQMVTRLIADDLVSAGFTADCSPCLDLSLSVTSKVIGDRAFSNHTDVIKALGGVVMDELLGAGILSVIKHIPGHGRGTVDSHHHLPTVTTSRARMAETDFVPFQALARSPWAMTAHIVFEDIDARFPATQSKTVVQKIIRGEIGFDGLLLTDDLNMNALEGPLAVRAERALDAGVDIIVHCSGDLAEMREVAAVCPKIGLDSIARAHAAEDIRSKGVAPNIDRAAYVAELKTLLPVGNNP